VISSELRTPLTVTLLKVTLSVVATGCPIAMLALLLLTVVVTPVPPSISRVSVRRATPSEPVSPIIFNIVATLVLPALVNRPCWSTVKLGIAVPEP